MRTRLFATTIAIVQMAFDMALYGQSTFQNLDFEAALIPGGTATTSFISIGSGLPGWTGSFFSPGTGTLSASQVAYDAISMGGATIAINDSNTGFGFLPLQGSYTACLFGGAGFDTTISQTGLVPNGSMSLQLEVVNNLSPFIVMVDGQVINMVALENVANYTLYGGDISAFGGQTHELSFTLPSPTGAGASELFLDGIVFSPSPVPEPAISALLFGGGALLLGLRRLRGLGP